MIEALVFDFDGLLVDTEWCDYLVWSEIYQSYGIDLPLEVYAGSIGAVNGQGHFNPYVDFEKKSGVSINWELCEPRRVEQVNRCATKLPLLPGVKEYLVSARQKGLKLAVASSSSHEWVDPHLKRLRVDDFFQVVKCAEDVDQLKPAPDLYLAALMDLDVIPGNGIAFEDSIYGVAAAKQAGLFCVAVSAVWKGNEESLFHKADLWVESLSTLSLEELLIKFDHG